MALARRGTRVIVVDGERLRWVVAPDDEPGLAIVVERAEGQGQRMVTWVEHGTIITPRLVAQIIRDALEYGWTPRELGRQITFRMEPSTGRPAPITPPLQGPPDVDAGSENVSQQLPGSSHDVGSDRYSFQDRQDYVGWGEIEPNQIPHHLVSVGSGWRPLLLRLHEQLLAIHSGYGIAQLKEKYGMLRIYLSGSPGGELGRLVAGAEQESSRTCESCGNPGVTRDGLSWIKTLCDDCHGLRLHG